MNLSSVVYYQDQETGEYVEYVTLESTENRTYIAYENIPTYFEHAVVAVEDKDFYKHHGVDWSRTVSAFFNMFLGMKNTYGGSTITQQLIKNVTGYDDDTVRRKITEIFRALEFEDEYDKWQIIEWYLNEVYFGHGQYGIVAASEYFRLCRRHGDRRSLFGRGARGQLRQLVGQLGVLLPSQRERRGRHAGYPLRLGRRRDRRGGGERSLSAAQRISSAARGARHRGIPCGMDQAHRPKAPLPQGRKTLFVCCGEGK